MTVERACCCRSRAMPVEQERERSAWIGTYLIVMTALAVLWGVAYSGVSSVSHWLVFTVIGLAPGSRWGASLEFFIYDTVKIFLLLVALIYVISWLRASLDVARVRDCLAGKRRGLGYVLGALFGAVTPFCSCSSVPLFLGFTMARIPLGISMSFLITSPLINEIAVVLLWGLLGWKFTVIYVCVGMAAGIAGGVFMDSIRAERWLQPFIKEAVNGAPASAAVNEDGRRQRLSIRQRHVFARGEMLSIVGRVWKWVVLGVGIGASLHGFVPESWFAENFGAGEWWTVPAAVLAAIPLYSNVTGIVPVMESLLLKGLPLGTTMAFCMSAVAASIPEVMMLRQMMTVRLQAAFIGYLWGVFTLMGWLFNSLGPFI